MHLVQFPTTLDAGPQGIWPQGRYVMEDKNAAEMILMHPDAGISANRYVHTGLFAEERPLNATLIAGGLGLGDAIMLTPVLRRIKSKWPNRRLVVACFAHYRQALENLPYIDGFEDWPITPYSLGQYDRVHFLENFQGHALARTEHMTDVFADICGELVKVNSRSFDHKADYIPTEAEAFHATENFPRVKGRKRLAVQVQASARCRTYPFNQLADLCNMMIKDGWEVYLLGAPGEFAAAERLNAHLYDARRKAPGFRESAALLQTCDAFVGPDSGFLHAAGAMGVPSVGLFGAFPWKLRTAYYPNTFAIQGTGECSPCFHSPTKLQSLFPAGQSCAQTGKCEVLATITPERIAAKIKQICR